MLHRVAVLLLAILPLAACSGDPSSPPATPTAPTPSPSLPPSPTAALSRVWLCCGSSQVSLNTQRQVELRATYADGSTRDVTSAAAAWKSSNPQVATISDKGIVKGLAAGDFQVTASYEGVAGTWDMYVPANVFGPAGADEVTGYVRELTANGEMAIRGAEVEVAGGASNGRKVVTNTSGFFRITGLQSAGFDLIIRDPVYSSKRFRVNELGRDVSAETVMTLAPAMVSEVLEGPVCWPQRTVTTSFTPATSGVLRITSSRFQSTIREVYEDGRLVNRHLTDNTDQPTRAGSAYELRVTGSCDYNPAVDVRLTLLRPR